MSSSKLNMASLRSTPSSAEGDVDRGAASASLSASGKPTGGTMPAGPDNQPVKCFSIILRRVTRQKRPKYTVKSAPIKCYMGFVDSSKPPTSSSSFELINYEFFILKPIVFVKKLMFCWQKCRQN